MRKVFMLMCGLLSLRPGVNVLKSTIRALALFFAATAALLAPAVAAQPAPQPASPPPQPEASVHHTPPVNSFVPYDAAAEAQKAQLRSVEHRVPASSSLCPPPYHMTARDGCQR